MTVSPQHRNDDQNVDPAGDATRNCPSCGSGDRDKLDTYSQKPWTIAQCRDCSFVYLANPPRYEALEEDFAWEKTYAAKKRASKGSTPFSPISRRLRMALRGRDPDREQRFRRWFRDGAVLDVGCGSGHRIRPPMVPYGIELSRELHSRADKRMRADGGYCVHGAGAEAIWEFDENQFDGIVMNSYLEHEVAVEKVLTGAYRALKPTGAIFVRVPNYASLNRRVVGAKWCGFRHPDHVNYFTPKTLAAVARKAGFSMIVTNPVTLPLNDNINALLRPISNGSSGA